MVNHIQSEKNYAFMILILEHMFIFFNYEKEFVYFSCGWCHEIWFEDEKVAE